MITTAAIVLSAIGAAFSALALLRGVPAFTDNLDRYSVPRSWWPWLGALKLAGAVGVLSGLWLPALGLVASSCLVAYFLGAVITVARSKIYRHLPIPLIYLGPPAVATVLLAAR